MAGATVVVASRKAEAVEATVADLSRLGPLHRRGLADLSDEDGASLLAERISADHH